MSSSIGTSKPPTTGAPRPSPRTDAGSTRVHPHARPTPAFARLLLDAGLGAGAKALPAPFATGSAAVAPGGSAALAAPPTRAEAHGSAGLTEPKPARDAKSEEACGDERPAAPFDPLDPAARQAAQLAPPAAAAAPQPVAVAVQEEIAPRARVSMEELLPQLVKRIAWAGDRRRGSVQLELGAGRHAGTTVTVHADAGRVRVELDGVGADALRERIRARLARQGLDVESVT